MEPLSVLRKKKEKWKCGRYFGVGGKLFQVGWLLEKKRKSLIEHSTGLSAMLRGFPSSVTWHPSCFKSPPPKKNVSFFLWTTIAFESNLAKKSERIVLALASVRISAVPLATELKNKNASQIRRQSQRRPSLSGNMLLILFSFYLSLSLSFFFFRGGASSVFWPRKESQSNNERDPEEKRTGKTNGEMRTES